MRSKQKRHQILQRQSGTTVVSISPKQLIGSIDFRPKRFQTKELSHINYFPEKNYNIELALSCPLNVSLYIHFKAGRKGISVIRITICSHIFIDLASYFTVARMKNNCTFKGLAKMIHSITCKACISFIPAKICRDALLKKAYCYFVLAN